MSKHLVWLGLAALSWRAAVATELNFDFREMPLNQTPPGFRSTVFGQGKPGDWKVILDDVPPLLAPLSTNAPVVSKRAVLAQLSQDATDEHFPLLIYEGETFTDFTLTTRFKTVSGAAEQMAGVAFRIQDETNYYVVRASSLGNTFRFYKVVNGARGELIGPEVEIPKGIWHELEVRCKGNEIRCSLDGKELIPPLTDTSFRSGKIGFWTKSDSVSYFFDTKLTYAPRELPAKVMVRDVMKKYPRLLGLKVYAMTGNPPAPHVIASSDEKEVGVPGGEKELDVLEHGTIYWGKEKTSVAVMKPLRDRNGDVVAAVRVRMRSFLGETEQNALVRAMPIVKAFQVRVNNASDLME
jgi:hypothetical protein